MTPEQARRLEKNRLFGIRYGGLPTGAHWPQPEKTWRRMTWGLIGLFALCETVANWLAGTYKVAWGPLLIPGGAFVVPIGLLLRDALQLRHPRSAVVVALIIGAGVSATFNATVARVAFASVVAFVVGFSVDTVVFTALRGRTLDWRMRISNWAALPVDTLIFVPLAFGGSFPLWSVIPGQLVAKLGMTEIAIAVFLLVRFAWRGTHAAS